VSNQLRREAARLAIEKALATATAEANASREQARREIDAQRESALGQLKGDAEKLGDLIVDRLLAAK
jgi:F-type H+-transporting ATPase subunit b